MSGHNGPIKIIEPMADNPRPTTNAQWQRHIRTVAVSTANIVITGHAQERMCERNVLASEVFDCLQHGSITRPPRAHLVSGRLICRMEFLVNGRKLTVAVDVESNYPHKVLTVTVIA